jgi:carbon starvation protein
LLIPPMYFLALGFRFYAKFLATEIAELDDGKPTLASKFNDGKDYLPTNKSIGLFFYHYVTIMDSIWIWI